MPLQDAIVSAAKMICKNVILFSSQKKADTAAKAINSTKCTPRRRMLLPSSPGAYAESVSKLIDKATPNTAKALSKKHLHTSSGQGCMASFVGT